MSNRDLLGGGTALVAGGGRGMGAVIAATLADAGAQVGVIDVDPDRAHAVSAGIAADGGVALPLAGDLLRRADVERCIETARERLGPPDVLVNVAGGMIDRAPWAELHDWTDAAWDAIVDINLRYVFTTCRAVLPGMVARGRGSIVNIASLSGALSAPRHGAYGAAKAGLINLTRSMAAEYGPSGVRVNAVAPGGIATPATSGRVAETELDVPLGSWGKPQDVADAVLFLASPRAGYITGQTLLVDGGASVKYPVTLP